MVELYFWTTPNGMKPLILLEETGLAHDLRPVNISKGEQFTEAFTRISPNQKIPAIVDRAPAGGPESGRAPVRRPSGGRVRAPVAGSQRPSRGCGTRCAGLTVASEGRADDLGVRQPDRRAGDDTLGRERHAVGLWPRTPE